MNDPVKKAICKLAFEGFFDGKIVRGVEHYTIEKIGNDMLIVEVTLVELNQVHKRNFTILVEENHV